MQIQLKYMLKLVKATDGTQKAPNAHLAPGLYNIYVSFPKW